MLKGAGLLGALLCLSQTGVAQTFDAREYYHSTHRMGAFQCIRCPKGGFVEGVRHPDDVRARHEFSAIQALCIATYREIDDEYYLLFKLDDRLWPDDGNVAFKVNSWNAECHLK